MLTRDSSSHSYALHHFFIKLTIDSVTSNDTAPSNDAFDKLPEGTVESLLLPENIDQLVEILLSHVISGNVHSSSLISGEVLAINGNAIGIDVSGDGGVAVTAGLNSANVVTPDVIASNGIIHVIDEVLLPGPPMTGTSYCTYSPDVACYESGWPSCCGEDGAEACPEDQPPCEIDVPSPTTNICLTEEDCKKSASEQGKVSLLCLTRTTGGTTSLHLTL
jgi:hypothetical protein